MSNEKQESEKERLEKATQLIIIEDFSRTRTLQDMAGSCFPLVMFSKVTNLEGQYTSAARYKRGKGRQTKMLLAYILFVKGLISQQLHAVEREL